MSLDEPYLFGDRACCSSVCAACGCVAVKRFSIDFVARVLQSEAFTINLCLYHVSTDLLVSADYCPCTQRFFKSRHRWICSVEVLRMSLARRQLALVGVCRAGLRRRSSIMRSMSRMGASANFADGHSHMFIVVLC